jgi:serine/threonine protein phosphatase PrpC
MKSILTRFVESSLKDSPTAKITYGGTINNQNGNDISYAVSSMLGRRNTQEDASAIETELRANDAVGGIIHDVLPGHALFAVFDGHGTGFASTYASTHFVSTLCKQPEFVMYSEKFFAYIDNPQPKSRRKCMVQKSRAVDYRARGDTVELRTLLEDAVKRTMIILDANMLREITSSRANRQEKRQSNASWNIKHEELYDEFDTGTTATLVIMTPQYIICANLVSLLPVFSISTLMLFAS